MAATKVKKDMSQNPDGQPVPPTVTKPAPTPPPMLKAADDDEEGGDEEVAKSGVSIEDLEKSLATLEELTVTPESRQKVLLKKAVESELTDEERDELQKSLAGSEPVAKALEQEVIEPVQTETIQKSLDVSDYLTEFHKGLDASLGIMAKAIEGGQKHQFGFNVVLAKAVVQSGRIIKAMAERLGTLESQPARGPKSVGARPAQGGTIEKGFGGQQADGDQLKPEQILQGLEGLMLKSMREGRGGVSMNGEPLEVATSRFEQTRDISKSLLAEVTSYVRGATH